MGFPDDPGILVQPDWDYIRGAFTLHVDWSALYPEFDEDTSFRVQVLDGDTIIADTSTVNNYQAMYGARHLTAFVVRVVAFIGWDTILEYETSVETGQGLPGHVGEYEVDQQETSLGVSWEPVPFASGYHSALYLDNALVQEKDHSEAQVLFEGLPHSRRFRIEIEPYNEVQDGLKTEIQTHTVFLVPPAPHNIRQFEERIIAVDLRWDLDYPETIDEVQLEGWDGDTMFLQSTMDAWQRDRVVPCPSTGTTYLFRMRSGNPSGWSDWVEFEGYTEVFPLIDSRLAALAATYQESVLHEDTWIKGATDNTYRVPDETSGGVSLKVKNFLLEYRNTNFTSSRSQKIEFDVEVSEIQTKSVLREHLNNSENTAFFKVESNVGPILLKSLMKKIGNEDPDNSLKEFNFIASCGEIKTKTQIFLLLPTISRIEYKNSVSVSEIISSKEE